MSEEKVFANGFSFKRNENAPQFVVGRLSMKVDDAVAFLKENEKNGWVNISIKYARSGNPYCELDNFEPAKSNQSTNHPQPSQPTHAPSIQEEDELPF